MASDPVNPNAIFAQTYDKLEREAMKLSYQISLDEVQEKVYRVCTRISDMPILFRFCAKF